MRDDSVSGKSQSGPSSFDVNERSEMEAKSHFS